jgi:hypothetical protein
LQTAKYQLFGVLVRKHDFGTAHPDSVSGYLILSGTRLAFKWAVKTSGLFLNGLVSPFELSNLNQIFSFGGAMKK